MGEVHDAFLNLDDILNRSIVLHVKRDDFTTQPAGDSGDIGMIGGYCEEGFPLYYVNEHMVNLPHL